MTKQISLQNVSHGNRQEKDKEIHPIRPFTEDSAPGIKQNGNQKKTTDDANQFNTPIVFALVKEMALN